MFPPCNLPTSCVPSFAPCTLPSPLPYDLRPPVPFTPPLHRKHTVGAPLVGALAPPHRNPPPIRNANTSLAPFPCPSQCPSVEKKDVAVRRCRSSRPFADQSPFPHPLRGPQTRCPSPCPSVDQRILPFPAVPPIPLIPKIPPNPRPDKIPVLERTPHHDFLVKRVGLR